MNIDVTRRAPGRRITAAGMKRLAGYLLEQLELPATTELSVLITTDGEIHALNRDYRGKDRPTDVLSFSMREGGGLPGDLLGDIVISLETCERQAREKGWTLEEEVGFLTLHGMLHLLGYDHEKDDEAEVMEAKTQEVWARVHGRVIGLLKGERGTGALEKRGSGETDLERGKRGSGETDLERGRGV